MQTAFMVRLPRFVRRLPAGSHSLEAIQSEISSRCMPAYASRPIGVRNYPAGATIMPIPFFMKLRPHFSGARHVQLQGRGEPMLSLPIWKEAPPSTRSARLIRRRFAKFARPAPDRMAYNSNSRINRR